MHDPTVMLGHEKFAPAVTMTSVPSRRGFYELQTVLKHFTVLGTST
jgi:hypothetical protein